MESCFVKLVKVHKKEVQVWRLCTLVPRTTKTHIGKFTKKWFGPYRIQFCLPNNIVLLVTLDNFDPNFMLVNVNKLKTYQFLDEETQTIDRSKLLYWEGQKYIEMDYKDDEHQDESHQCTCHILHTHEQHFPIMA